MNHPHHSRQSISDWEIEHRECLGLALEQGITELTDAEEFLRDHMQHVDYGYLKQLWDDHLNRGLDRDDIRFVVRPNHSN